MRLHMNELGSCVSAEALRGHMKQYGAEHFEFEAAEWAEEGVDVFRWYPCSPPDGRAPQFRVRCTQAVSIGRHHAKLFGGHWAWIS